MTSAQLRSLSNNKLLTIVLVLSVFYICPVLPLNAKSGHEPFDSLTFSLNYIHNSNRNLYHRFWHPNHGIEFDIETPFYFGIVEGGLQYANSQSWMSEQPGFWSLYSYLGWGVSRSLTSHLNIFTGFNLGTIFFSFDDPTINDAARTERELGFAVKIGLTYRFSKNSFLNISLRRRTIFTSNRIKQDFIAVGLGKSFGTPNWLKEFLK